MKKTICILILLYYSLGSIILPASDFSIIPELPELYSHCKLTEDKDMNVVDFITDHLMNIDGIFDSHNNGDEQKPHNTANYKINGSIISIEIQPVYSFNTPMETKLEHLKFTDNKYGFDFVGNIFRPPIA